MNPNHLFIGLGGTGGKIIRALRKTIFQEFRKEHPEGVNIAYLYVDSSTDLMDLNDPSWKLLGTSVQLGENSKLVIKGANLASILDNINNFPNIKPWIGDRAQWDDILNGIVGDAVGGQKRRLGRFLFANHARKFCEMVTTQVRELQTGGQTKVTFHVVCGLAGGTGSGTLIDTIAQIRKLYPNSNDFRTLVYVFLPEEQVRTAVIEANKERLPDELPLHTCFRKKRNVGYRQVLADPSHGVQLE
jgi:cell division GTPase FtsZ